MNLIEIITKDEQGREVRSKWHLTQRDEKSDITNTVSYLFAREMLNENDLVMGFDSSDWYDYQERHFPPCVKYESMRNDYIGFEVGKTVSGFYDCNGFGCEWLLNFDLIQATDWEIYKEGDNWNLEKYSEFNEENHKIYYRSDIKTLKEKILEDEENLIYDIKDRYRIEDGSLYFRMLLDLKKDLKENKDKRFGF